MDTVSIHYLQVPLPPVLRVEPVDFRYDVFLKRTQQRVAMNWTTSVFSSTCEAAADECAAEQCRRKFHN